MTQTTQITDDLNPQFKTGFLFHEICMWHDVGNGSHYNVGGGYLQPTQLFEHPETKRRLRNLLEVSGVLDGLHSLPAEPATIEDTLRFHTAEYIEHLKTDSAVRGGNAGDDAPYSVGAFAIALQSAGMAKQAVRSVLNGEVDNAYSLNRPPGHHAVAHRGEGFCLLGNIPIAIKAAQAENLVKRVAVLDWDVHHGNGTQSAFYDDADVLTMSIHHDNNYPFHSGGIEENGEGNGKGYNINIPLPAGCGNGAYQAAIDQIVIPALTAFQPELIVVACGFDAAAYDPLGCMILNSDSYREMTEKLMRAADALCDGKLVFVHEGGYSDIYVPFCGLAVIEALSGQRSQVIDHMGAEIALWGQQQELFPHQQDLLDKVKPLLDNLQNNL